MARNKKLPSYATWTDPGLSDGSIESVLNKFIRPQGDAAKEEAKQSATDNPVAASYRVANSNRVAEPNQGANLEDLSDNSNIGLDHPIANSNPVAKTYPLADNNRVAESEPAVNYQPVDKTNQVANSNPMAMQPGSKKLPDSKTLPSGKLLPDSSLQPGSNLPSGYLPLPNYIIDGLLTQLKPIEAAIYLRLYRLSHGFQRDTCSVSLQTIASRTQTSKDTARRSLRELQDKGLIKHIEFNNSGNESGGSVYQVFTIIGAAFNSEPNSGKQPGSNLQRGSKPQPGGKFSHIKDHDSDDSLNTDHHQSEHEKEVMMIYQSTTGNNWKEADQKAYQQISHIGIGVIEQGIRVTLARATSRPNSLAYFVKEICNQANPSPAARGQRRQKLEQIIARVRELHAGGRLTIGDLADEVKIVCAREGIGFDSDLFNEIVGI